MDRVATFKSFIEQKPQDPFPRYGLAMEYRNTGQYEEAQEQFDLLAEKFPEYLPAYLMSGNNLADLERKEDAMAVLRAGVDMARKKGDAHTRSELEAALSELQSSG